MRLVLRRLGAAAFSGALAAVSSLAMSVLLRIAQPFGGGGFLPAIERRGPLRVRALVCVRCPRTGKLRRCRRPRYAPISINRFILVAVSRRRSPSTLKR